MKKHLTAFVAIMALAISSALFAAGPGFGPGPGGPKPNPGPVFGPGAPGPKPGPGPAMRPGPGPKPGPGPAVRPVPPPPHRPGPGPAFRPVPPPPHHPGGPIGHHTFPHRHPTSRFAFRWYDYAVGGVVYAPETYKIYECRNCHLVNYSPVVPVAEPCAALPGYGHAYQILGTYGQLAFTCATCGVTVNSATVPAVGACGGGYHAWQQLLQY